MKLTQEQVAQIVEILDGQCEIREKDNGFEFVIGSALASLRMEMINKLIDYRMALVVCVEDNTHLKLHIS